MEKHVWKWFIATCSLSVIALAITFMQEPLSDIKPAHVSVLEDPTPPRLALGPEKKSEKQQTPQNEKPSLSYTEYIKKGDELALLGEFDQAVTQYLKANRIEPLRVEAFLRIGNTYLHKGSAELAKENFLRAIQLAPEQTKPRIALAYYYIYEKNFNAADKILETVEHQQEALYMRAMIATLGNRHTEAKKLFEEAAELDPQNPRTEHIKDILNAYRSFEFTTDVSDLYLDMLLAKEYNQAEQYTFALEKALNVIREKPNYRDAWLIAGHTYLNLGKFREAHIAISRALSYDTEKPEILFLLALAYQGLEDFDAAIENYISALRKGYPNTTQLAERLAEAYSAKEDYENAIKHYETVIANGDKEAGYYVRPVWIYIEKLKQPKKALDLAGKAFKKFPEEATAYNLIGWSSIENGSLESAKRYLEKAIEIDPELDAAYMNLGYYFEKKGEIKKAKELYKKAERLAQENHNTSIANLAGQRYDKINQQTQL